MVEAFKQWRVYLEGATVPVKVYTDHENLEYFSTACTTSRRHATWASTLAAYTYTIVYRKGAANGTSDAVSRRADHVPPPLPSLPILPFPPAESLLRTPYLVGAAIMVSPSDPLLPAIVAAQAADPALAATIQTVLGGPGGELDPALPGGGPLGRSADQFSIQGDFSNTRGAFSFPLQQQFSS